MRGFTIIELLLVTSLVALLLSLGVPALRTLQGNIVTTVEHHRLLSLLRVARSKATAGRRRTVLCPLAAGAPEPTCGPAAGADWLLFADGNGDRRFRPDDDELIRVEHGARPEMLQVLDRRGEPFAGAIAYRPDGSVYTPATLQLCGSAAARNVRLVVSMSGRARTAREDLPCA